MHLAEHYAGASAVKAASSGPRGDVSHSQPVALDVAGPSDAALLANLLELYIHDLSAAFPNVDLGRDGRFGYPQLPLYWSEPDRRFAFLIRCDGRVAGFVLATRGVRTPEDPDAFDIAEFFVLRKYRRLGVGRQAALLLWNKLPGRWTVRVSEGNTGGVSFWADIVAEFTKGAAVESMRVGTPNDWRVFTFASAPPY
jgi:predicted acetyltransferase